MTGVELFPWHVVKPVPSFEMLVHIQQSWDYTPMQQKLLKHIDNFSRSFCHWFLQLCLKNTPSHGTKILLEAKYTHKSYFGLG